MDKVYVVFAEYFNGHHTETMVFQIYKDKDQAKYFCDTANRGKDWPGKTTYFNVAMDVY